MEYSAIKRTIYKPKELKVAQRWEEPIVPLQESREAWHQSLQGVQAWCCWTAGRDEKVRVRPPLGRRLGGWGLQLNSRADELLGVSVRPLSGLRIRRPTLRPTHFSSLKAALFCDQRLTEAQSEVMLLEPER